MTIALPGFADPVLDAQACFRALLDAMARPGRVRDVGGVIPPAPLAPATAAALLTLVDADTPLWLAPGFTEARDWIAFHCGCPFADNPDAAAFAVDTGLDGLDGLTRGSDEEPERSATLIAQIESLEAGAQWILSGPGLLVPAMLAATGLPEDFAAVWARNRSDLPRGVDLVLCAGTMLTALPRSVTVADADRI